MRLLSQLILLVMLPATAWSSEEFTIYECEFRGTSQKFLPESATLFVSNETDSAFVIDGMIHYVYGEPIEAEIQVDNDKKVALRWSYIFKDGSGRQARLSFRFSYLKLSGKAIITSRPVGYTNSDEARGSCTLKKSRFSS
ncbi:hypothetical protein [Boseongicola aestuarii]|uniref:Uncharacterized protein n=1 Tax=Boseongicola aestuarii TaxID=1470561 RepID=A0A238J7M0_9RHOB|nr:hypothetical protein [Boseongicola aestuarii]SMX25874.1 hypothetical protein BOA8489_04019 [Boseongicola aestuarii]